jgi:ribosomal protein S18 acetylase RimI-like enzyme
LERQTSCTLVTINDSSTDHHKTTIRLTEESDIFDTEYESSSSEYSYSTDFSHASTDCASNPEKPPPKWDTFNGEFSLTFKRNQQHSDGSTKAKLKIDLWKNYDPDYYNHRIGESLGGQCFIRKEPIGHITAKLINRNRLRENWTCWLNFLGPDASLMARELFDRYGCIKDEFLTHTCRKGSGVFGEELNDGNFLFIETIRVEPEWRQHRVANHMVLAAQCIAAKRMKGFAFTIVKPGELLGFPESSDHRQTFDRKKVLDVERKNEALAVKFWRGAGFRRVGCSGYFIKMEDRAHGMFKIGKKDDYDVWGPKRKPTGRGIPGEKKRLPDEEFYGFLKKRLLRFPVEHGS